MFYTDILSVEQSQKIFERIKDELYDDYVTKMKQNGTFVDGLCLSAFCIMLEMNIIVVTRIERKNFRQIYISDQFSKNIFFFFEKTHY